MSSSLLKLFIFQQEPFFLHGKIWLLFYPTCTLCFKLFSNKLSQSLTHILLHLLNASLSITHSYIQSIYLSLFLLTLSPLIPGFLTNKKTTLSGKVCWTYTRARTRLHPAAPAAASLHRKQASGCYRSSPCLLSKV